jgi:hypothetical protein
MYSINVKDWRKIPLNNLLFIFAQAELRLNYTIQNSDKITARFYSTLIILIGIFTAGIGYLSNKSSTCIHYDHIYFLNLFFLINLLVLILCFIYHVSPRDFMGLGRSPHELSNPDLLEPVELLTEDDQYKSLIIGEINNLENKISFNTKQNQSRLLVLKRLIYSIVISATIYFILYQGFVL